FCHYDLRVMSSFTSSASVRRRCFFLSANGEYIVTAHGPFLETLSVTAWEQRATDPTVQPTRVKVFPNALIHTALLLGTGGHVVAISDRVQEKPGEQYKVFAAFVDGDKLATGGYATNRFIISSSPSKETASQPSIAVVPGTNKLLLLTGSFFVIYDILITVVNGRVDFQLCELKAINFMIELGPRFAVRMSPLAVSSIDPFDCLLLKETKIVLITRKSEPRRDNKRSYDLQAQEFEMRGKVTAVRIVPDMKIAIVAVEKALHLISLMCSKNSANRRCTPIATTTADVVHITVSDRPTAGEKTVATMEIRCIRLWGLTRKELTPRGSIDFDSRPWKYSLRSCDLFHRVTAELDYELLAISTIQGD
ncbi:hypothetical protein PFISCL1PPCAC_21218, partial [Pristionchus fissidentatus]